MTPPPSRDQFSNDIDRQLSKNLVFIDVDAIVIGRNEESNLARCLNSLSGCRTIIYVDSCSTDNSVALAADFGAHVVRLEMSTPFTAARARNAGFRELCLLKGQSKYIQFVDGDCEVYFGWIPRAIEFLEANQHAAAVCGRRFERFPEASIYNSMCDSEWNSPIGEAESCGGDAMMRACAFASVHGFADEQVAHEEPEFCGRLRSAGWTIWRIDQAMTLHDAAIHRFGQFYKRNRRAGFGISQCLIRSRCQTDSIGRAIIRRALAWSLVLPGAILLLSIAITPIALLALLVYPAQIARQAIEDTQGIGGSLHQRLHASSLSMLGKLAETHGSLEYVLKRLVGVKMAGIFYK